MNKQEPFTKGPILEKDYGRTMVILMPCDPGRLYAYWEVSGSSDAGEDLSGARNSSDGTMFLRLYRHEKDKKVKVSDIPVEQAAGSLYIPIARPGGKWSAEIGLLAANGAFSPKVSSDAIFAPEGACSGEPASGAQGSAAPENAGLSSLENADKKNS